MTLNEIAILIKENWGIGTVGIMILMSLVQVSKIPINPWSWIGNALNKDMMCVVKKQGKDLDSLKNQVTDMQKEVNENSAMASRYRILRFDDEIRHGTLHTKEHYDRIS